MAVTIEENQVAQVSDSVAVSDVPAVVEQQHNISITANRMYETSSNRLLMLASDPKFDVTTAVKLWDMQKEAMAMQAKVEYNIAMAKVQGEIPPVPKRGNNPQTRSQYALLQDIIAAARPVWSRNGFSVSYSEGESPIEDSVRVLMYVSHTGGDVREFRYDVPLDDAGIKGEKNKTDTHAKASSVTYGQRYLTNLVFAIEFDSDDDGNAAGTRRKSKYQKVNEEQSLQMQAKVTDNDMNMDHILRVLNNRYGKEYVPLGILADVPAEKFDDAMRVIDYAISIKNKENQK